MKKALLLSAVLLFALTGFADTTINNFNGYNDYWHPFGDPRGDTQTYGEVFTVPDNVQKLLNFSFYMGNPIDSGQIITGAYIATWTGTHAGFLLYDSGEFDYDNLGNEKITFSPTNLYVNSGQQYVMFLSTSKYSGQSFGSSYVASGNADPYLNGFAYFNNGNAFLSLFEDSWDASGLSPDWAVELNFDNTPEPSSLMLLGSGLLTAIPLIRRSLM